MIQSMAKRIEGAYRRCKICPGSSGERYQMTEFIRNQEGHAVKMKINMDVMTQWRKAKITLDSIWGGLRMVINNVQ